MSARVIAFPGPKPLEPAGSRTLGRALREMVESLKGVTIGGRREESHLGCAHRLLISVAKECASSQPGLLFEIAFALASIEQEMQERHPAG